METKQLIISLISLYVSYVVLITIIFGWLRSVSHSYYEWEKIKVMFIFPVFIAIMALLTASLHRENTKAWIVSGVLMFLVGVFPEFNSKENDRKEGKWHVLAATGYLGSCFVCLMIDNFSSWYFFASFLIIALPVKFIKTIKIPNEDFWVENLGFVCVAGGLIFNYLNK